MEVYPVDAAQRPTFAKHLTDVLSHTFSSSPTYTQGIIAQDWPIDKCGSKRYYAISDMNQFAKQLIDTRTDGNYYELLPATRPVYPYLDAEWDPGQLDEEATLRLIVAS
jgi:hypothetical protein